MIQALVLDQPGLARTTARIAFDRGLIIETCGPDDEALKLLPPLIISETEMAHGLGILADSLRAALLHG